LTVRAALLLGRWCAFVDTGFTTAPTTTVEASAVTARVRPVGAGVALRLERPRWRLSAGPRASLQIVDAEAHALDGRVGAARRYSAGLGLSGDVTWRFSRWVGALASVGVEALVPRLQFAAGGAGTTDLGWVQFAFALGLTADLP
jgi:hypothetical protein